MKLKFIFSLGLFFLSQKAFAYHEVFCQAEDQSITACYLSDAPFGFIIAATLNDQNKIYKYDIGSDKINHVDTRGIAVVHFTAGQRIEVLRGELEADAFNEDGTLMSHLKCSIIVGNQCDNL